MSEFSQKPTGRGEHLGLQCPRCGHRESRVRYTRRRVDGLYRRRKCLACGKRFTTCERRLGA